jgi:hypothetical protein
VQISAKSWSQAGHLRQLASVSLRPRLRVYGRREDGTRRREKKRGAAGAHADSCWVQTRVVARVGATTRMPCARRMARRGRKPGQKCPKTKSRNQNVFRRDLKLLRKYVWRSWRTEGGNKIGGRLRNKNGARRHRSIWGPLQGCQLARAQCKGSPAAPLAPPATHGQVGGARWVIYLSQLTSLV